MDDESVSVARALGLHHTLVTAIADLVDNSVDAGAGHVLVRFMQTGRAVSGLRIIDDGKGMDRSALDAAMRYGAGRSHDSTGQGHFGVGLKAASLSQADRLTVYSRARGHDPVAADLRVAGGRDAPIVEAMSTAEAAATLADAHPRFPFVTGTVVAWRGIRTFPVAADPDEQATWLEATIVDVRSWLGLVFHRKIVRGLTITIDVFDTAAMRPGAPRSVHAIDPFGYRSSGAAAYPRTVPLPLGDDAQATLHVWPARSSAPEYRLGGGAGRDAQGLFIYRNDRLLQAGGWLGAVAPRPDWAPARVAIDLDTALAERVTINPEKAGVAVDATFTAAVRAVLAAGYLDDVAAAAKAARRVRRRPITVVEPGAGLPDEVADEFADSFTFADTAEPVDIGWRVLAADRFFEVDLDGRTLWINARFRRRLSGRRHAGDDVPLLRTLVYLLVQDMFDVVRHSARQVAQMEAWQHVLIAAMAAEGEDARWLTR